MRLVVFCFTATARTVADPWELGRICDAMTDSRSRTPPHGLHDEGGGGLRCLSEIDVGLAEWARPSNNLRGG